MDSFQNRPHSPPAREVKFSLRGRGHGTLPEPREKVGEDPDHLALEACEVLEPWEEEKILTDTGL